MISIIILFVIMVITFSVLAEPVVALPFLPFVIGIFGMCKNIQLFLYDTWIFFFRLVRFSNVLVAVCIFVIPTVEYTTGDTICLIGPVFV
jgi:hypothetical protein